MITFQLSLFFFKIFSLRDKAATLLWNLYHMGYETPCKNSRIWLLAVFELTFLLLGRFLQERGRWSQLLEAIFKRNGLIWITLAPPLIKVFGAIYTFFKGDGLNYIFLLGKSFLRSFGRVSSDTTKSLGFGNFFMIKYGFN